MFTLFIAYFLGSIFLILLSLPLMYEKVKPNPFYGFRVPATLDDPALWYPVNKFFAKRQLVVGVMEAIASFGLYLVKGINIDGYAFSVLAVFVVAFSIAVFQSWKFMNSLRQQLGK